MRKEQAMNIGEILQAQTAWLDKARAAMTPGKAPVVDPAVSLDATQKRAEIISQRVADLKLEQKRTVDRYDAAIAELAGQLTGLEAALSQAKALLQNAADSPDTSTLVPTVEAPSKDTGAGAPPKRAIAAVLPTSDVEAATLAKKSSTKTPSKKAKTKARPRK
jgi:hypothetical protein